MKVIKDFTSSIFNKQPEIDELKAIKDVDQIEELAELIFKADAKRPKRKVAFEVKRILMNSPEEKVLFFLQHLSQKERDDLIDRFLDKELFEKILKAEGLKLKDIQMQMMIEAKRARIDLKELESNFVENTSLHLSGALQFFPKLVITFLERLGDDKVPSTAWESYILLEIYFRFLILPYIVFNILLTLSIPALTALLVTVAATAVIAAAAYTYVRFFNIPKHLENAENISEKAKQGKLPAYAGNEDVLQKMLQCRSTSGKNLPILLIGEPGVGKTATVQEFIKILLSFEPKVQMHDVDPNELVKMNIEGEKGAKFDLKLKRVKGYERTQIFFIDELHKVDDLEKLGKTFDTSDVMIIAATTLAGYKKLKQNQEAFQAFRERVQVIKLKTLDPSKEEECPQLVEQVRTRILPLANRISVDEGVYSYAVNRCDQLLKGHVQPRIAINILREAINYVRQGTNPEFFKSNDLIKAEKELDKAYTEYDSKRQSQLPFESTKLVSKVKALEGRVESLKKENEEIRRKIKEVSKLKKKVVKLSYSLWKNARNRGNVLSFAKTHLIALPALSQKVLEMELSLEVQGVPMRLDTKVVERIILEKAKEYREEEEKEKEPVES